MEKARTFDPRLVLVLAAAVFAAAAVWATTALAGGGGSSSSSGSAGSGSPAALFVQDQEAQPPAREDCPEPSRSGQSVSYTHLTLPTKA